MKATRAKHTVFVGLFSALLLTAFAVPALAASPAKEKQSRLVREPVLPENTSSSTASFGVGFAAVQNLTSTPTALTAVYQFDRYNLLQGFMAIESTSPIGRFNAAAIYKHSILEGENAGVHIGFGAGAGNVQSDHGGVFAFTLVGVAGLHATMPGLPNIKVHLDGGPQFSVADSNSSFAIHALSPALGLSIYYQI